MAPAPKPTPKPKPSSKGGLAKKVGPLPVWAWGVLVLAVVAFFVLRSRGAGAAGTPAADLGDGPLATGGNQGGGGGASGSSQDDPGQQVVPVTTGPGDPAGSTGNGAAPSNTGGGGATPTADPGYVITSPNFTPPWSPPPPTFKDPGTVWTAPPPAPSPAPQPVKPGLQM